MDRLLAVAGTVDRIIGSHDVTDVQVSATGSSQAHASAHVFVNSDREFVMLLEVAGRTLRLAHDDPLAVAPGDAVRAVCDVVPHAPLHVLDWRNETRGIAFRIPPTPLRAAAPFAAGALAALGVGVFFASLGDDALTVPDILSRVLPALAVLLAWWSLRTARAASRTHAAIDRLAAPGRMR